MRRTALLLVIALLLSSVLPRNAQAKLIQGDYNYDILHLESNSPVLTWEDAGVRVFVVRQGAVVRQGPVRLAAPNMVVWFDVARSARPDVHAAVVKVYAEGIEAAGRQRRAPVRLAEGRKARECGAAVVHFKSALGFSWDCPLVKSDKPVPSVLLGRAEAAARGLEEDACWEAMPPAGPKERPEAVERVLSADEVEVFEAEGVFTLVYFGNVRGTYEDFDLQADAAVLWYDPTQESYEVYAQGNVRVSRRPGVPAEPPPQGRMPAVTDALEFLSADELYVNPKLSRGLGTKVEARMKDPRAPAGTIYIVRANQAFMVDSQTMTLSQASVTPCDLARPHFQLQADRMELVRQAPSTLLMAWNVHALVGEAGRSLVTLPFIGTDLTRRAYLLTDYAVGVSKQFGAFVQTTWSPLDLTTRPAWIQNWTVNLDYYGARGPAIGTDFWYDSGKGTYPEHRGHVRAFFLSDSGTIDQTTGEPVPQTTRGLFHLEHRTQLNPDWRVDAEYYWLSDAAFLREFFPLDFQQEKTPESYLLARYLHNSTYLALLYKQQVNKFITDLEERPSADLEIVGLPLGRLVYDGSVVAGLYDLQPSDQLTPPPANPPSLWRLHTDNKLSLPFSAGIFRFSPFVRAVATWAGKSVGPGGTFDGATNRLGVGAGMTASTTFWRSYDVSSDRFELNRLRHVVVPYASIEGLTVSGDSADFIQMDGRDAIDTGTEIRVGVRQRLETKRLKEGAWRPIDWVKLDVALVSRSSHSVMKSLGEDYIFVNFNMQVTDHISVHSEDDRFGLENQPNILNLGATLDFLPRWALRFDFDTIANSRSTLSADLAYRLSDRYQLLFYELYALNSGGGTQQLNSKTVLVLRRFLHDWVLDVGLQTDKAAGGFGIVLGFGPSGWGVFQNPHRAGRGLQEAGWAMRGVMPELGLPGD